MKTEFKDWRPQASEKAPQLDEAITNIFGIDRKKSVEDCTCAMCGETVSHDSFKDEISLKEFHISAMCQPCQDKIFG